MLIVARQMNNLQRVLPSNLMMQVVDCLLEDVNWLVCQMLGNNSQVVPERMTLIMVDLNWSPLHESELTMWVGGGFVKPQD